MANPDDRAAGIREVMGSEEPRPGPWLRTGRGCRTSDSVLLCPERAANSTRRPYVSQPAYPC